MNSQSAYWIIDFWNSIPGAVLNVSLVLNTDDDMCVLNTTSPATPMDRGSHRAICVIPGGFLNDQTYCVRVLLVQDTSRVVVDRDRLLTFELHDTPRTGTWFGKWVGVVRPALSWALPRSDPTSPAG